MYMLELWPCRLIMFGFMLGLLQSFRQVFNVWQGFLWFEFRPLQVMCLLLVILVLWLNQVFWGFCYGYNSGLFWLERLCSLSLYLLLFDILSSAVAIFYILFLSSSLLVSWRLRFFLNISNFGIFSWVKLLGRLARFWHFSVLVIIPAVYFCLIWVALI